MDEPIFVSLKQFIGEQLKAVSHLLTPEHLPTSFWLGNKSKHRGVWLRYKRRIPSAGWPPRRPVMDINLSLSTKNN